MKILAFLLTLTICLPALAGDSYYYRTGIIKNKRKNEKLEIVTKFKIFKYSHNDSSYLKPGLVESMAIIKMGKREEIEVPKGMTVFDLMNKIEDQICYLNQCHKRVYNMTRSVFEDSNLGWTVILTVVFPPIALLLPAMTIADTIELPARLMSNQINKAAASVYNNIQAPQCDSIGIYEASNPCYGDYDLKVRHRVFRKLVNVLK